MSKRIEVAVFNVDGKCVGTCTNAVDAAALLLTQPTFADSPMPTVRMIGPSTITLYTLHENDTLKSIALTIEQAWTLSTKPTAGLQTRGTRRYGQKHG